MWHNKVTCPGCGAADDYSHLVALRRSFSMVAFLFGGLIAVLFHNAGKPSRVRCNKCEVRFYIRSRLSKVARVIFWLLVAPTIVSLVIILAVIMFTFFSH
jgi:hypothetical protein